MSANNMESSAPKNQGPSPITVIKGELVKYRCMFKSMGLDFFKVTVGVFVGLTLETLIVLIIAALWVMDTLCRHRFAFRTMFKVLRAKLQKKDIQSGCDSVRDDVSAGLSLDLRGMAVVVTGAAGGFGAIVSRDLVSRGAVVYALDVCPTEAIEEAVAVEKGSTGKVVAVKCDITKADDIRSTTEKIAAETVSTADTDASKPVLYAVLNNAGITGKLNTVLEGTSENMRQVFDVNVFGAIDLSRSLLPHMVKSKNIYPGNDSRGRPRRGRIINVTSQAGLLSSPFLGNYCGTKFALESLSDSIRCELQDYIDVAIIEPFFAATNIVKIKDTDEELRSAYVGDTLIKMKLKADQKSSNGMMAPEFVAEFIVRAIVDPVPKDRYPVVPNVFIGLLTKIMLHTPNYCKLVDHVKRGSLKLRNLKKNIPFLGGKDSKNIASKAE